MESNQSNELDPRIQIELENLNTATEEINKLEIELEEANSTFHILYNESTRRLKLLIKKLGSCIEKSRPYYESSERARSARLECQAAAAEFRRANEIHAAAKETVALAEERFMSNTHNWPFDNAWQEMLNHATNKVAEAEKKKAEAHAEHQRKALICNKAEFGMQQIEERQRRNIQKSRPYFEEKQLCQEQLETQKERIHELEVQIRSTKASYAMSLKNLEKISEEIHQTRGTNLNVMSPTGPREPGVGATADDYFDDPESCDNVNCDAEVNKLRKLNNLPIADIMNQMEIENSAETMSLGTSSVFSEDKDDDDARVSGMTSNSRNEAFDYGTIENPELNVEELRQKVKLLAVRPVEGSDDQTKDCWETELNETVNKLDRLMMMQENIVRDTQDECQYDTSSISNIVSNGISNNVYQSSTKTFLNNSLQAMQQKMEVLLPNGGQVTKELPLLSRISNEISTNTANTVKVLKRRLSLN